MNRVDNVFYWLPCAVVFVSTTHGDKRDIMTANAMFVSEKEPLLAISVAQDHLTDQLIRQSGRFTLVIAGEGQQKLAAQAGSSKGEQIDKFEQFSIKTINSDENEALVPEGSAAWMACEVESSQDIKGYRIYIGRVVDQQDLNVSPLVWQKDAYFSLKQV
ncbi:MAG: flavin reductase family protein [Deltaproteobacteria bacterium]|jgi:flavin reductase (DIM6/NTAB) family NADH-FMN oxidoreductase RutF|nr:flavin reductase family protein [Deltaproteobacteria bacterium]